MLKRLSCCQNLKTLSVFEQEQFINSFDTIFTDCDGVLNKGLMPISGAAETINHFKQCGKSVYYFTNNSLRTLDGFLEKFTNMGFNCEKDEILCTANLTAEYLKMINHTGTVYLLGAKSIKSEIEAINIPTIGEGPDVYSKSNDASLYEGEGIDENVTCVVVSRDLHISYNKLCKATEYITRRSCNFLVTNADYRGLTAAGSVVAGSGSIMKALEASTGKSATVIGKPSTFAFELIQKKKSDKMEKMIDPKRCIMIGDSCNTDILFGNNAGMQTILVLTGYEKLKNLENYKTQNKTHLIPNYYTESIADLLQMVNYDEN